ncbi:TraB/GumN family protein [Luteimonas sp. SX5]|uniref:TraB/GumN family protein n=1 Tax=Luteimonas galliterrae TaxID=2940486 RepID=A0ABT0MDW3_9GAMM|nr:TraB/GumN family protein [Luteimonas galliterrae]MCL1633051.1 TraB/GumN family protein [Luteimonas galliterrae]
MRGILLCLALAALPWVANAQSTAADEPLPSPAIALPAKQDGAIVDLQAVVVSGSQPGPGLWRVSKGDHVLWILGTQSPLPRRMEWESGPVEKVVSQSQEVIQPPSVGVKADVGFFRMLGLIPSALKARRNPDDKTLQQVVPADQYARWQRLKAHYIGKDRGIERWRPVFAALELYDKAIEKSGMTTSGVVAPVVAKMAKRYNVKVTPAKVEIPIAEPRRALKEFSTASLDDLQCFEKTLDRIQGDLDNMVARANAWAVGDINLLRDLPANSQFAACSAAFTEAGLARKYGMSDLAKQVERKWLSVAEAALANNASTFAMLPIGELLKTDGYMAKLQAKGYQVQAP